MTAPNSDPNKLTSNDEAYQLGTFIGCVVEKIDSQLTLEDEINLIDSLDQDKKDQLECRRNKINTYESRSQNINRKWKRY